MSEQRLEHLIADLLQLERAEVCRKLKPLRSQLIDLVSQNTKITLKGILEIQPVIHEQGTFLNTHTKKLQYVGPRVGAKAKIRPHFDIEVKQNRLKKLELF